jgi:hypothetical protein
MPDDFLSHVEALLTREMSNMARFLSEIRRLRANGSETRPVQSCVCPNGHPGATYYAVPDVVRCPICGISDVADTQTVQLA